MSQRSRAKERQREADRESWEGRARGADGGGTEKERQEREGDRERERETGCSLHGLPAGSPRPRPPTHSQQSTAHVHLFICKVSSVFCEEERYGLPSLTGAPVRAAAEIPLFPRCLRRRLWTENCLCSTDTPPSRPAHPLGSRKRLEGWSRASKP